MMNCYNCTLNWRSALCILALGLLVASPGRADDLGVTMRMVESDEDLNREIVQEIRLPERLESPGRSAEAPGRERAEEAREKGRSIAEQARERREAKGRPDDLPGDRPDTGGDRPESPELEQPGSDRPGNPQQGGNPRLN